MLWDFETRVAAREGAPHVQAVTCLAWSRCGRYVVTGSRDSCAALWDVARGEVVRPPTSALCPLVQASLPGAAMWVIYFFADICMAYVGFVCHVSLMSISAFIPFH